ncbi:MAG: hypothetical protein PHD19_01040 [Dechloromonas sp.]|nr:hypothetical protein [Dechloromonas sp.]
MKAVNPLDPALPVWQTADGSAIACIEKIRVLNENCREFRQVAFDLLEDGVLLGCTETQLKDALFAIVAGLRVFAD